MKALCFVLLTALTPLKAEIQWVVGPAKADIGGIAEIEVPEGWRFVPKDSMEEFDKATNNLHASSEVGCLVGPEGDPSAFWAFFEWDEIGYVKDAATEKMDPDAMWKSMVENQVAGNEARKAEGMTPMDLVRWELPPSYNPSTQRLEWATRLRSQGKEFVNFSTKILGRQGVMRVVVVPQGELDQALLTFNEKIYTFAFAKGKSYAEWLPGDKIAKVGLSALVVGGATALAAKSGLLGKFWKLIVLVVIAGLGMLKGLWAKLTGRSREEDPGAPPPPTDPTQRRSEAAPTLDDDKKL